MKDVKSSSIKVVLKVTDEILEKQLWVHFCYIEKELYLKYLKELNITSNDLNERIISWVKQDFNTEMRLRTTQDLDRLKNLIKNYYKEKYPELYIESNTDNQGWIRVWVTMKMKEELNENE